MGLMQEITGDEREECRKRAARIAERDPRDLPVERNGFPGRPIVKEVAGEHDWGDDAAEIENLVAEMPLQRRQFGANLGVLGEPNGSPWRQFVLARAIYERLLGPCEHFVGGGEAVRSVIDVQGRPLPGSESTVLPLVLFDYGCSSFFGRLVERDIEEWGISGVHGDVLKGILLSCTNVIADEQSMITPEWRARLAWIELLAVLASEALVARRARGSGSEP